MVCVRQFARREINGFSNGVKLDVRLKVCTTGCRQRKKRPNLIAIGFFSGIDQQ